MKYLLTVEIVYSEQDEIKLLMYVVNHFWLNYNELKQFQQILILVHFHYFLSASTSLFVLPNNFIVSGVSNSNL